MTKNFNITFESILGDLALKPVGALTVTSAPEEECVDCGGEQEEIAEDISEYEIAENIIRHAKALRKKVGEESYYRIRAILDNANQLKELHPNIEMIDSTEVTESVDKGVSFLSTPERQKINNAFHTSSILKGIQKVRKPSEGVSEVNKILDNLGYTLDMVSGDILLGDQNTRHLSFRKKWTGEDPFNEHPQIENSRIVFTWENLERPGRNPSIEIIAYAS
jgi:hypothetical protein